VLLVGPQQRKQRQPGRLDGRVGGQRPSGIVLLGGGGAGELVQGDLDDAAGQAGGVIADRRVGQQLNQSVPGPGVARHGRLDQEGHRRRGGRIAGGLVHDVPVLSAHWRTSGSGERSDRNHSGTSVAAPQAWRSAAQPISSKPASIATSTAQGW
jgi:hypothetical protein